MFGGAILLDQPLAVHPARDYAGDLRAAVAAQVLQVNQQQPASSALQLAVVEAPQRRFNPLVAPLVILCPPELQRLRARHDLAHLLQRTHLSWSLVAANRPQTTQCE